MGTYPSPVCAPGPLLARPFPFSHTCPPRPSAVHSAGGGSGRASSPMPLPPPFFPLPSSISPHPPLPLSLSHGPIPFKLVLLTRHLRSAQPCTRSVNVPPKDALWLPTSLVQTLAQLPATRRAALPLASPGPPQRGYLMVTRGSWATPHTMEAWVPLMTLWSWGGLVMRVRAERQQGPAVRRGAGARATGGRQGPGRCRPAWLGSVGGVKAGQQANGKTAENVPARS